MRSFGWMSMAILCLVTLSVPSTGLAQLGAERPLTSAPGERFVSRAGYAFVAAEFMELSEIEQALPLLAARRVGLVLAWASTEIDNPAYYQLVRRAEALGVEVRPWLVLPIAQGYWPNSQNAAQFDVEARRLITRWREQGLRPTTFLVDMEMPWDRTQRYAQLLRGYDPQAAIEYLRTGIDRRQYAEATRVYRELVWFARLRGFRVEVSVWSQVLDDYVDGDDGLRQAFNVPLEGIDWDVISVQAYRTLNQAVVGPYLGATTPYYVFDYALRARQVFGSRAAIGVGLTDAGEVLPDSPLYRNGSELREDLEAARAAGLPRERIGLYSLLGIVRRPPTDQWFPQPGLITLPPLPDAATVFTRTLTAVLDAAL